MDAIANIGFLKDIGVNASAGRALIAAEVNENQLLRSGRFGLRRGQIRSPANALLGRSNR